MLTNDLVRATQKGDVLTLGRSPSVRSSNWNGQSRLSVCFGIMSGSLGRP